MSFYKVYLGDEQTLVNNPKGWESLLTVLEKHKTLKGLFKRQDGTFDFGSNENALIGASAFDYLFDQYSQTWNSTVPIRIDQSFDENTYHEFLTGTIVLSDSEFDLKLKYCKAKILDNSFQAKIVGNIDVGALLYASRSRLNKTITPITPVPLSFFNPVDGAYYPIVSTGGYENNTMRVYDALRFIIDFVTEGTVAFVSDTFGVDGPYYNYFITTGRILELVDSTQDDWPSVTQSEWETYWEKISLAKIFSEIDKRFNLRFQVDAINTPTARIETDGVTDSPDVIFSDRSVDELKLRTFTDYLYSKVMFGQGEVDEDPAWSFPEQSAFIGFRTEEFQTILEAPFNRPLDLKTDWITSSNVIQKLITDGLLNSRDNDRKIFIIEGESDGGGGFQATKTNNFSNTIPYFYNQSLTNDKIAQRFFSALPSSIATFLNTNDYSFRAVSPTYSGQEVYTNSNISVNTLQEYEPVGFSDDYALGFDPSNVYGNGTAQGSPVPVADSRMTFAAGGVYTLNVLHKVFVSHFKQIFNLVDPNARLNNIYLYASIKRYDASDNLISKVDGNFVKLNSNSSAYPVQVIDTPDNYELPVSATFSANTSDYVQVSLNILTLPSGYNVTNMITLYRQGSGSTFATSKTITGGGIYQTGDSDSFKVVGFESKTIITEEEFSTILANPNGKIELARSGESIYSGQIENLKFPHEKGEANIVLRGSHQDNF